MENKPNTPAPAPQEPSKAELLATIDKMNARIAELEAKKVRVDKPNPSTIYVINRKATIPPTVKTRQIHQVAGVLVGLGKDRVTEPELFEELDKAKADGRISTDQSGPRIFRYYKTNFQAAGMIS